LPIPPKDALILFYLRNEPASNHEASLITAKRSIHPAMTTEQHRQGSIISGSALHRFWSKIFRQQIRAEDEIKLEENASPPPYESIPPCPEGPFEAHFPGEVFFATSTLSINRHESADASSFVLREDLRKFKSSKLRRLSLNRDVHRFRDSVYRQIRSEHVPVSHDPVFAIDDDGYFYGLGQLLYS